MRLTYSRSDKKIGIDGVFIEIENLNFDPEVSSIQWYDTYGEIEFVNRQEKNNKKIDDIAYIEPLIKFWQIENSKIEQFPVFKPEPIAFENQKLLEKLNNNTVPWSEKKLFVYVHIPKTAGTFIKSLIFKHQDTSDIFDPFTNVTELPIPVRNAPTIKFLKEVLPATRSDQVGFFVVVRNPYDRIYSMWKWSRKNGTIGSSDFPQVPTKFEEFVVQLGNGDYDEFYFMQSQLNFIEGEELKNLNLFKFEDMGSVKNFCQKCRVNWSEKKINHVTGPNYKDVYTHETTKIVKEKYEEEFKVFGYSTEL
jgi:hypothetical protein